MIAGIVVGFFGSLCLLTIVALVFRTCWRSLKGYHSWLRDMMPEEEDGSEADDEGEAKDN